MRIAVRADASSRMGTGHVMRCLTLAEELRRRGAQLTFICREHHGHLIGAIGQKSFAVATLPAPDESRSPGATVADDYAAWLGVSSRDDAAETIEALDGEVPDWLVVDHYGLGRDWEQQLRRHAKRLLVIDDLAGRAHDCDALLDQNFSGDGDRSARDALRVPEHCALLLGPRYALLAADYQAHRQLQPPRGAPVRRVLIYFGGADPTNVTGLALAALCAPEFLHLSVDVVVGTNHSAREGLIAQAAGRPRTCVHGTRPNLADLMVGADMAIGAGGGTTWERMCLGLPTLVVSIADNQRPTCEALAAAGLIAYLGDAQSVDVNGLRAAVESVLNRPAQRAELCERGGAGRWARRVSRRRRGARRRECRAAPRQADAARP
jgi:UDP-2,4-diacetamido-2,4,6-trideoxy-beta-L-altropyranose hydrolase